MNPSASTPSGGKSADEMRRSSLNMEKMIKKNVMASRPGSMKRGLAVVEMIKQQQQKQQEETEGSAAKRSRKDGGYTPSSSATTPSSSSVRTSQAMSALVGPPATPLVPNGVMSPVSAPASATTALLVATHRSSPLRTTSMSAAARASPLRAAAIRASPLRSARASPLRQVFTSPSRRVVAPRLPEVTSTGVPPVHPPVLNLDQLDVTAATPLKPPTLPAKSPFQSFQSKLGQARLKSPSPARPSPSQPPIRRANPLPTPFDSAQSSSSSSAGNTNTAAVVDLTEEKASTLLPTAQESGASTILNDTSALSQTKLSPRPLARSLFSSDGSVATKSLCFTTEGVASSIDVSPDGECIVVAFTDGSIRLYEMDSNVPSDRHGYLLGHLDEESNQSSAGAHLRVKISSDGRYAFVGCRSGPRVMMSINLQSYRNGKDADDDMDQMQKSFHSNSRLRGFSDVASCIIPNNSDSSAIPPCSYYLLCGLGVGTMYMWRFSSPRAYGNDPEWKHLYSIPTNGNTVVIASFLPQATASSTLQIAGKCEDKNVRVWNLDATKSDDDDTFHTVQGHYDLSSSKDVVAFFGQYAYGIAPTGEACRFRIPSEAVPVVRIYFDMERFDTGSSAKSRRSNVILESIFASDDGMVVVAVSADGIFYYTKDAPEDPTITGCTLRIIGRNASLNAQYRSPMKVYKPIAASGSCLDAVMAVITNPQNEDDGEDGFVNVDLTEKWAGRWMKPSRGDDCWVCGVRNIRHWQKDAQPQRRPVVETSKTVFREAVSVARPSPAHKLSTKAKSATPKSQSNDSPDNQPLTKSTNIEAASRPTKPSQHRGSTNEDTKKGRVKPAPVKRLDVDGAATASADDEDAQDPVQELARLKTKYDKITIEWKRRILGERQMRRLCKEREEEFQKQLSEAYTKLHEAEQQIVALTEAQKDAEKRFGFEKLKAEQQSGVKAQYEQLCEQMQEKMVALEHQQRLMEQTTRSLLQEVDRHVQHSKQSVNSLVERQQNECILCKDSAAVTAIVPCGHLCFCDEDAEVYRRNFRGGAQITCPICQADVISMLRIY